MSKDASKVRVQTDLPQEVYDEICNKNPVVAMGGDSNLLRHIVQQWLRDRELEEMQATGQWKPGHKNTQIQRDSGE